jgi:ParB family chromosome partitioning protein
MAGLDRVPAIIRNVADDAAIAMSLIENIQRENLNPIEEAFALQRLQNEFALTQQQVAEAVGKSRSTITNLLRLIGLVPDVRIMLEHGDIEMGHAKAILGLDDTTQLRAAKMIVSKGLSVRQTESFVRRLQLDLSGKEADTPIDPDVKHLIEQLSEKLGAKVAIAHSSNGKGKLVIQYNSLDELDGIIEHIK